MVVLRFECRFCALNHLHSWILIEALKMLTFVKQLFLKKLMHFPYSHTIIWQFSVNDLRHWDLIQWEVYPILALVSLILSKCNQFGQMCAMMNIQSCFIATASHNVYMGLPHFLLFTVLPMTI